MKKRLPLGYSWRENQQNYQCRFTYRNKKYYVYGKTIEDCEQKKAEKLNLLQNGLNIDNRNITLRQYYKIWLEEQKKSIKESSLYTTEKYWKYIDKTIGGMRLADIRKQDIIQMQQTLHKKHSADTINRSHKLLSQIMNAAIADRMIDFNYAKTVKKLKTEKIAARDSNHRALSTEEQELFFKYAKKSFYYNLFSFLINTGLRVGEALALTWKDIDKVKKEITISKTVMKTGGSKYTVSDSPKTASSIRRIPITPAVAKILDNQRANAWKFGKFKLNGFIFTTRDGEMSNYNNVNSAITRVLKAIERDGKYIEHFSVHAFRDTFATRCIEQGMPPIVLKELLGHSSLKMTMDVYAHVMPNTKHEELNKIEIAI